MNLTLDLGCGVSGDMLLGALLDMYSKEKGDPGKVMSMLETAASVQSPTKIEWERVERSGKEAFNIDTSWKSLPYETVTGTEMKDLMRDGAKAVSMRRRGVNMANRILRTILEAEAAAHNVKNPDGVHLHEAGTPDTIVDALGIGYLYDILELDGYWINATPVSLGSGMVATQHGTYDVPVPAVRNMLRGLPYRMGPVEGELATPTGMAAARALVEMWKDIGDIDRPKGTLVGRGAGNREYGNDFPNVLGIYVEEGQ